MKIEVSLVCLRRNAATDSGFSVATVDGQLPTAYVATTEEFLDTAFMLAWKDCGIDSLGDCAFIPLDIRDLVTRKEDRTVCQPYLIVLSEEQQAPKAEWVDMTHVWAHDHMIVVREAFQYLRANIASCPIGAHLLGDSFTVQDYRRLCEQISNDGSVMAQTVIHPSNFRRKFENLMVASMCFVQVGELHVGRGGKVPKYQMTGKCPLVPFGGNLF